MEGTPPPPPARRAVWFCHQCRRRLANGPTDPENPQCDMCQGFFCELIEQQEAPPGLGHALLNGLDVLANDPPGALRAGSEQGRLRPRESERAAGTNLSATRRANATQTCSD